MKRTLTFFFCVAVCCTMAVSCKNAKTVEPTPEEIQAQKVALADSVLAQIDAFVNEYILAQENAFGISEFKLTEEEKMVKPDYLLEPSFANTLVTKSQKINALGIYMVDLAVRIIYDMPLEETKEVIAKLAVEMNLNVSTDFEVPVSERIKKEYEACKERGELAYFWQFHNALCIELGYLFAQNSDLFYSKITEEQWQGFERRIRAKDEALKKLAHYDEESAQIWEFRKNNLIFSSKEEADKFDHSIKSEKQFRIANKDKYTAQRNALLQ